MERRAFKIIILMVGFFIVTGITYGRNVKNNNPVDYLKAEATVSSNDVYEGEPFTYTVNIKTDNPHVRDIRLININSDNEGITLLTQLQPSGRVHALKDGLYELEISSKIYKSNKVGTLEIEGATYRIEYVIPTTVYDPFWGYVQSGQRYTKDVTVKPLKIKSKALPKYSGRYNGGVGDFKFVCDTPTVKMTAGGEISIFYTISGEGLLQNITLPLFKDSMPSPLRLKSVSPEESVFIQNGKIISRLTYECRITSNETGSYTIIPIPFTFFSTKSKRYVTLESNTCTVTVGKSVHLYDSEQQYVYNPDSDNHYTDKL